MGQRRAEHFSKGERRDTLAVTEGLINRLYSRSAPPLTLPRPVPRSAILRAGGHAPRPPGHVPLRGGAGTGRQREGSFGTC